MEGTYRLLPLGMYGHVRGGRTDEEGGKGEYLGAMHIPPTLHHIFTLVRYRDVEPASMHDTLQAAAGGLCVRDLPGGRNRVHSSPERGVQHPGGGHIYLYSNI